MKQSGGTNIFHALKQWFNSFSLHRRVLIVAVAAIIIAIAVVLIDPVRFWDSCFRACKVSLESLRETG